MLDCILRVRISSEPHVIPRGLHARPGHRYVDDGVLADHVRLLLLLLQWAPLSGSGSHRLLLRKAKVQRYALCSDLIAHSSRKTTTMRAAQKVVTVVITRLNAVMIVTVDQPVIY